MTRFLVTGASGLLGINFSLNVLRTHEVIGVVHTNDLKNAPFLTFRADLFAEGKVEELLRRTNPDVVIHCAAMANIDQCELNPQKAYQINSQVPGEIAKVCLKRNIKLIHISTDAVFDGATGGYTEKDLPNPVNLYGKTKLAGELAVLDANPDAIVARVNFYGWSISGNRSLAEVFFNNLSLNKPMRGFIDVFFCPFEVKQLSDLLVEMAAKSVRGIFHVTNPECISKFEFGQMIAKKFGFEDSLLIPSSWKDGGLNAARSPNLVLKSDKLVDALGCGRLPGHAEGIDLFFNQFKTGLPETLQQLVR